MSPRTLVTAMLVAALPFAAVACGDDEPDDAGDSTTTTVADAADEGTAGAESGDDTTESTDSPDSPDATDGGDPESATPFAEGLVEARARLDGATSICDLADVSEFVDEVGQPQGRDQIKAAVEFQADLWNAIADSAPPEFAAQAEVIRGVAQDFPAEAQGVDYDFDAIGELESISSTEFSDALGAFYQQTVASC